MVPFNFKRCMRLTGDLLIENKKSFLLLWAIPLLALELFIVLMGVTSGEYVNDNNYYSSATDAMWGFNLFMMVATGVMMCCIAASRGLSNTSNKQLAISSLTLPVSEKERYWARFIIYVPMYTLAFALGLALVECMRYGILSAIYPHTEDLRFMLTSTYFNPHLTWCIALYFLGVQSYFYLSGAIWPKIGMVFAFVFFIAMLVVNIILATIVFSQSYGSEYFPERATKSWDENDFANFMVGLSALFCLISCGINYTLAYFRCKEREIINRW